MWSRSAYLIDGVRLEADVRLAPLLIHPVPPDRGYVGRDGRAIFNRELHETGFVSCIDAPGWGVQFAPRHRLALVVSDALDVGQRVAGTQIANVLVNRVSDLLALTHGGAPRVVAGVTEISDDEGAQWRTLAIMAGGGPFPGSILERLATENYPVESLDIATLWTSIDIDPRVPLWLSLYRGTAAEPLWDIRMFRICSLLETVAGEIFPRSVKVTDPAGTQLIDYGGQAATTKKARGAIYMLLGRCLEALSLPSEVLLADTSSTLWAEVGIWVDVRNAVAHEGHWPPAPLPNSKPARQKRVAKAFEQAAPGEGLDAGWSRYADTCGAAAEVVLRAAGRGYIKTH